MQDPLRIGILHSLRGPMAMCETAMVDAALLAVEEINSRGGLLGRPLQAIIADGESDPAVFRNQARKLVRSDKAQALFGCWTSSARKAVRTVVEEEDSLLWYPVQYEGLEQSPNIVYTGSCLNQQIQPFIEWCLAQGWKRFFLVGSEYVFPHTANKLIHSLLHGVDAQVVGEKYFSLDCDDFAVLLPLFREAEPDIIINTVNGSANLRLFEQVLSSPLVPERLQAFSTSCTEIDYARIGKPAQGHLSCWSYFQSFQNEENQAFIAKYRTRFGHDRLVSDPIVTAYAQVNLWAAVVAARKTFYPGELKDQLTGQTIQSPLGRLEVCFNRHVARKALIGRYTGNAQHDILWQSQNCIEPLPWIGMEEVDIPSRTMILDLLKEIPEEITAGIRLKNEIKERQRAEEELLKKSTELELYFTSSLDLLCIANTDGQFIRLNPEWESVLGYSITELEGRAFLDFVHPEDLQSTLDAVSRLESQEDVLNFTNRYRCKDGSYRWIEWRSRPQERLIYATARDITERKRMEEALLLTQFAMDQAPDSILWIDEHGRVVYANNTACSWTGYTRDELLSMNIFELDPDFPVEKWEQHKINLKQCKRMTFEGRHRTRDGRFFPVEVVTNYIEDKGRFLGIAFDRDISDRRRLDMEREKLQSQLHHAQKMESLGTLAGGVAHDFNNLLQIISGNIQLLLSAKPADHEDTVRLNSVVKSIHRAAGLVKQLLLFGRKAESTKVPVDLNQEVEEAVRILERTIPKMIALELNLDQTLWPLRADPVQIGQVLLNLATNAVDAMPDGGRLVIETGNVILDEHFVRTHPGSTIGRHVRLSVTDTGCGMDKKTLGHVFDPFFTTKEVGKGTGLGLPSVYGIVKGHGGHIQCYSEPALGTVFTIFLPAPEQVEIVTEPPCSETTTPEGSETVLVVDDEPEILELTAEALESLGYAVKSAANGEEALRIYQNHLQHIDLVLLDLNMPGMGGRKCLQELLVIDPGVKVIISSGYTANGHGKGALSSGAAGFMGKPYQLKELAVVVRRVLDEKKPGPRPE